MYVTPAQLAEKPGATEISQVATSEHAAALVDPALMLATLRGESRDAWEPGEIAEADEALARVNQAIDETDALVDAYIRKRVTAVPVLPVPSILTRIARAIVRYELHRHRISPSRSGGRPLQGPAPDSWPSLSHPPFQAPSKTCCRG